VLVFMTMLINRRSLMKEWTNSRIYNAVSWTAVAVIIGLTLALVGIQVRDLQR
jgi:Mn2+/Fe2+ NRAMP family transporter